MAASGARVPMSAIVHRNAPAVVPLRRSTMPLASTCHMFEETAWRLSRTGSFHPGLTKWQVYPFGMRSR